MSYHVDWTNVYQKKMSLRSKYGAIADEIFKGLDWRLGHNPYEEVNQIKSGAWLGNWTTLLEGYRVRIVFVANDAKVFVKDIDIIDESKTGK